MAATPFVLGKPLVASQLVTSLGQTYKVLRDIKKPTALPKPGTYYELMPQEANISNWFQEVVNGHLAGWIATKTWIDNTGMSPQKCDGVLYMQRGDKYYKRALPDGRINMSWYLVGDGRTDNVKAWRRFNEYLDQVSPVFWYQSIQVFTQSYYISDTIKFQNSRIKFVFEGGQIIYPGTCSCFHFYNRNSNDYQLENP